MRISFTTSICAVAWLFSALPNLLFSQSITYQNPTEFSACGEAEFSITVQNTGSTTMSGATVTVNFTTTNGMACGIGYVLGSVSAPVTQANVSNPAAPQFNLPSLAAGASQTFTLKAKANCETATCIDNTAVFVNDIAVQWSGGNASVTTNPPYVVERALLLITNVANTVMSGTRDEVLQRKLTVKNTRLGAVSSFTIRDDHQVGITISSLQGTTLQNTATVFELRLGPADFATIGDGDGLFEFNETLVVTEDILIQSCGVDESSAVSNISVSWGCNNSVCQEEAVTAVVVFEPYDKVPTLTFEPIVNVPDCLCGPEGTQQGMKITNNGEGIANNISFEVRTTSVNPIQAFDPASVRVDSSGVDISFSLASVGNMGFSAPCMAPVDIVRALQVSGIRLGPNESVTIYWDNYYCSLGCTNPLTKWEYRYSYFKECPPNIFVQNSSYIPVERQGDGLTALAQLETTGVILDGDTMHWNYNLSGDKLMTNTGTLMVEMTFDCGAEWLPDNPMLLNNQAPLSLNVSRTDSFTLVTAVYQLPLTVDTGSIEFDMIFECDSVCINRPECEYELATTCTDNCPGLGGNAMNADFKATLFQCDTDEPRCNPQSCSSWLINYKCYQDSVCLDAPPGYIRYDFTALRKNYGLPDNNNDQLPDAPSGLPDMSLVSRHRFIPGDTIQTIIRGRVFMDSVGVKLPFGKLNISFFGSPNMAGVTRDSLLRPDRFTQAGISIRIFDSSAGVWYECQNPPFTTDSRLRYKYDFTNLKGLCLPANFAFEQDDSIVFVGNYRIGYNPPREMAINEPDRMRGDIDVRSELTIFNEHSEHYTPINCNCHIEELQLSYYELTLNPQIFALPPCGPSAFGTPLNIKLDLHQGNFFPFEYRNLLKLEDLSLTLPPSVTISSSRLTTLRWQNSGAFQANVDLSPNLSNNTYSYDLEPYQIPPMDGGFAATFDFIFNSDCHNRFSLPVIYHSNLDWAPGLPYNGIQEELSLTNNSLRPLIANLSIVAPLFDLVSYTNQMSFDFLLKNTPTIVSSQSSGDAPNVWLYVTSATGLVTDFQLINPTTGQPVPQVNGVFQLGNLAENPNGFPYRLIATNNSCERERLVVHYGWNCDPMTSTVQTPCYEQVQPIFITSPPGEIDMIVTSPTGCSQLCDTIPYHSIEVFNAQFGSVYNLRVQGFVPPGFSILSGSCVVEYPTGSGLLYPIGDPTIISTGVVEWNLSMLFDSIANGLPGVGDAPHNSLTLKFLGESTCDFVAEAYTLFVAAAEQNCGLPSNSVAKPGDPICIDGVTAPFTTNISVTPTPGFGCNDITTFEVSLASSVALPQGACLIATLPPGITYVPGSCQDLCANGLNCTPTINGSQITWQLPAGVLPSQLVCFSFNTQGWLGLGCENGVVLFRTAVETQALCAQTGQLCSTKVSTGSLIFPFDPQRPAYELNAFEVVATAAGGNNLVNATVKLTNDGGASQPPTIIQFFADTNGDGTGDILLGTQNYNSPIGNGQTVTISASLTVPSSISLCQLLAVLDASQQCACSGDALPVNQPITFNTGLEWTVCSGVDEVIGITAMPGFDYQWSPDSDCLADDQSATTVFNCENDGIAPETTEFTIAQSNGICAIDNIVSVTVQPVPGIAFADSPICQGESANLAATDGTSFTWQGPGIAQPNQQIVTVTPAATSQYSVTVMDAFGCSGTESVTVVVAPYPIVDAGPDITACPGDTPQLNASFDPDWDYLWSPQTVGGLTALSNAAIHNPQVLTDQATTFTLQVTDENGCSATDAVAINFANAPTLTMPADLTICNGDNTVLTVTSSTSGTFNWLPDDGDCTAPTNCGSYLVSPTTTTTYTVVLAAANGCTASGSVTVTVANGLIVANGPPIEICEGESVVINGQTVSEAGVYCDTINLVGGCDSVYCVAVLLKAKIDTVFLDTAICLGASVEFEGETFNDEGEYCVTLPGQNGCDSVRCLLLLVDDLGIKETIDTTICPGDSVLFEGQFYAAEGEYCNTYSTPDGCDSLSCLNLSWHPLPQVQIVGADTVSNGDTLVLGLIPLGPFGSIFWFQNDSLLADCTGLTECETFPTDSVTTFVVQVTDPVTGCPGVDTLQIIVIPNCNPEKAVVPNAFSPNGDRTNDTFDVVGPGAEATLEMLIWNRWGQKVYDGPGPWDGKQNGKEAPSDVYIYRILVGCAVPVDAVEREFKGDVTLLR